jgi:hypothetical protein
MVHVCIYSQSNAFNPSWDESFDLGVIHRPQLAVLRISVYNHVKNPVPAADFLCQATLPVAEIRTGYRWSKDIGSLAPQDIDS